LPKKTSLEELEKGVVEPYDGDSASLSPETKAERISVDFLEIGDIICVPHGATPPADGTITQGEKSVFDESSLTGESRLVTKESGDKVYVGTINKGRMAHVRVDSIAGGTMYVSLRFYWESSLIGMKAGRHNQSSTRGTNSSGTY